MSTTNGTDRYDAGTIGGEQSPGMMSAEPSKPFVSVVLPIRNEADFIERCLRSLLANDYPADRFELLVVDGQSDDGTRAIVQRLAAAEPRIRLLDNPQRIVPHAMNRGIREARGEIILRVDGHADVPPDFIRRNVEELQAHPEAWCVGGPVETVNETPIGRAIAGAMTSRVGVGNALFRLGNYEGYVDTLAFGAYRRWVFDRIGLFDEELVRNQDDELNLRIILAGGRIFMTPRIHSRYYPRTSLRKLAKQYFQYGFWRIRTIQKHRQPATLRQVVPLAFVLALILLAVAALLYPPAVWLLATYLGVYLLGLLAGTVDVGRRTGWRAALLAPVVFVILHFGYGLGSLKGVVWFLILRRGPGQRPEEHALSR